MHCSAPGVAWQLLLIPEYSGINKGQRIHERYKTAHRKPPVKCFLTHFQVLQITLRLVQRAIRGNEMLDSLPIAGGCLIPHIHKYLIKGQQRSA